MGRPKELSEEERQQLLAEGYRPIEIWLPDVWSDEFWKQMNEDCRLIRESDRRENMDEVLDAFARDLWDDLD
ncbi:MAG: antitoxin MazE family protein [Mesorhizobium sp.]|nr:antitoxin MazE family protein [Mesorhizobium sp.]